MPHGAPDASKYIKSGIVYPVFDIGELAVRLGSPVAWNRQGDVIAFDTFKNGFGFCRVPADGTGRAYSIVTDNFVIDGKALKIAFDGSTTGEGSCWWYMPAVVLGNLGGEILWAQGTRQHYIDLTVSVHIAATDYYGKVRFDRADKTLAYLNSAGAYIVFATDEPKSEFGLFTNMWKLVIDSISKEYVRFIANAHSYDLAGIDLRQTTLAAPDTLYVKVACANDALSQTDFWIDRAIFTQNEPA